MLSRLLLIAIVSTCAMVALPDAAHAALYRYETATGEVLITTQRRDDLKLIEVISGGGGGARNTSGSSSAPKRSASKRSKVAKNLAAAKQAKSTHVANHGSTTSIDGLTVDERHSAYDDIISEASMAYDVPFAFIKAVIRVESNFNPMAVSPVGAQGLMQLMPRTAANLSVSDPFDARQNIFGGAKLLRILIDRYDGDINLILSAYNAGDVAVNRYDGIPYAKTRDYVTKVYRYYKLYSGDTEQP